MKINRLLLLIIMLLASRAEVQAGRRPRPPKVAEIEARNETAVPGFSGQVHEAQRISSFLADALMLSHSQLLALRAHTLAQRQAMALALTSVDAAQAQLQYLGAVQKVLAASQREAYMALRQKLADTVFPLDGTTLAAR